MLLVSHGLHAARRLRRHRPAQHQAADGLFLHRPCRLRADGRRGGQRRGAARPPDLHGDLHRHERRHLRGDRRHAPEGQGGRGDRRPRRARPHRPGHGPLRWRCSCSPWPASRRSPASSASSTCSSPRCRAASGCSPRSACSPAWCRRYYYLRIVKAMYFDQGAAGALDRAPASLSVVMAGSGPVQHLLHPVAHADAGRGRGGGGGAARLMEESAGRRAGGSRSIPSSRARPATWSPSRATARRTGSRCLPCARPPGGGRAAGAGATRRAISPFRVLLRPRHPAREAPQWGLLGGVALAEAARAVDPEPDAFALRWPNDLLRHGAKCAGLLAESAVSPEGGLAWVVLGFGVNLAHAPEVPDRATARLGRVRRPRILRRPPARPPVRLAARARRGGLRADPRRPGRRTAPRAGSASPSGAGRARRRGASRASPAMAVCCSKRIGRRSSASPVARCWRPCPGQRVEAR